ncbi:MAG TPA: sterol desaturase family protein [Paucimonas sp.]|nr:sterol desaturase family protein [Paucimonas sp.]
MLNNNALIAAATPVFFLLIGIEAWLAHRRRLDAYQLADSLASLGCGAWTVTLEVFVKGGLLLGYAWIANRYALFRFDAGSVTTWILFFFVLDFLYYWAHRWSHEINFLWGGHVPHHQSEEFNLTTALRQGAFQDLMHMPIFLPMAVAGCPPEVFIVLLTFNKLYQFWIHTRLIDRLPLIEGILNTPSAHRVHHAVNDVYVDRNYGGTLMVWDKLFGTWEDEREACVFGVRKPFRSWNPVWAQFDWFAHLWRDAARADRWTDRLAIWIRRTGWRPADVAARDPHPPFVLADVERFTATRGKAGAALAVALFVPIAILNNILLSGAATLPLTAKLSLAAAITLLLLAMAWALQGGSDGTASR